MATSTPSLSTSALPARPVLIAFGIFVLIAGGASVAIRTIYVELAPFWTGTFRFMIASVIFWTIAFVRKIPVPKGRALAGAIIFGVITIGLSFALAAWGLVAISASQYQILSAMVPLFTIFLSSLHGVESITRRGILGSFLAVAGIAVTVGGASGSTPSLPHIGAIILSAVFMGEGGVVIKMFPPNPPIMTNAISITAGTVFLGVISLIRGEPWIIPAQTRTWVAFVYLVLIVTIFAFMLYLYVLDNWSASSASYGFVLIPLVTMVVATTLAGENITANFLLGAALVIAGVVVGALLPSKTKPKATEECKERSGQVLPHCI